MSLLDSFIFSFVFKSLQARFYRALSRGGCPGKMARTVE